MHVCVHTHVCDFKRKQLSYCNSFLRINVTGTHTCRHTCAHSEYYILYRRFVFVFFFFSV